MNCLSLSIRRRIERLALAVRVLLCSMLVALFTLTDSTPHLFPPAAAQSAETPRICSQAALQAAVQAGERSGTLDLDGTCLYEVTTPASDWHGGSAIVLRQTHTLNGNGAIIRRAAGAPSFRLLAVEVEGGTTISDITLIGGDGGTANGGAIWANSPLTLQNVTLAENRAARGGAIFTQQALTLSQSVLHENGAQRGGAVYMLGAELMVERTRLLHNEAEEWGGALALDGTSGTVTNTLFAGNVSPRGGAALHALGANARLAVDQSTFAGGEPRSAHVNPGAAIFTWGYLDLSNSILTGHDTALAAAGGGEIPLREAQSAEEGDQPTEPPQAKVHENYNLFANNSRPTRLYVPGTFIAHGSQSKLVADAGFVDAAAGDYRLRADSPAVDSGSAAAARAVQIDAANNARPYADTPIDMGAFEFQGEARPALSIVKTGPPWLRLGISDTFALTVANSGAALAENLQIRETLPAGLVYASNEHSGGGVHRSGGTLMWEIGDLAPGEQRRVTYKASAWAAPAGGDYVVQSLADERVLAVGKPHHTPLDTNIVGSIGFRPRPDGFHFANYTNSLSDELAASEVGILFGREHVCKTQEPCVPTATAEAWQRAQIRAMSKGHAAGMSLGALDIFANGEIAPGDFRTSATTTFGLSIAAARHYIAIYGAALAQRPARLDVARPSAVVDTLRENLDAIGFDDRYLLGLSLTDGSASHLVVPYGVEAIDADTALIHLYDPNAPEDIQRAVRVDRASETWSYVSRAAPDEPFGVYAGDASTRNLWLASWRSAIDLPLPCGVLCGAGEGEPRHIDFHLDGEGYLLITRSDGRRTGFFAGTGTWIDEIGGAERRPVATGMGLQTPPIVRIPHAAGATYTLQIAPRETAFGNRESNAALNIFTPGYAARLTYLLLETPALAPLALGDDAVAAADFASGDLSSAAVVDFDPARHMLAFTAAPREVERGDDVPWIAASIHNPAGSDYTLNVRNLDVDGGEQVTIAFEAAAEAFTVSNTDARDNVYFLHVERLNPDGTYDVHEQRDAADGRGNGLRLRVGSAWDGLSAPPITMVESRLQPGEPASTGKIFLPLIGR